MKFTTYCFLLCLMASSIQAQKKKSSPAPLPPPPEIYFPTAQNWEHRNPADLGLNGEKINAAVQYAIEQETSNPRSMEQSHYQSFGKEPFGEAVGPFKDRGAPTGLIIYKGYIVAEWGEPAVHEFTGFAAGIKGRWAGIPHRVQLPERQDFRHRVRHWWQCHA